MNKIKHLRVAVEIDVSTNEYIVVQYNRTGWAIMYRCNDGAAARAWQAQYLKSDTYRRAQIAYR